IILNGEEVEGRSEELEPFRVFSTRDCGRLAISTSLMQKALSKMKDSDDLFLQMFILYVMGVLLVPTRRDDISLSSVYAVTDVADIPKKNWASFCFNELYWSNASATIMLIGESIYRVACCFWS
ncbi:unnamed protein product, partial [Linum tenue]